MSVSVIAIFDMSERNFNEKNVKKFIEGMFGEFSCRRRRFSKNDIEKFTKIIVNKESVKEGPQEGIELGDKDYTMHIQEVTTSPDDEIVLRKGTIQIWISLSDNVFFSKYADENTKILWRVLELCYDAFHPNIAVVGNDAELGACPRGNLDYKNSEDVGYANLYSRKIVKKIGRKKLVSFSAENIKKLQDGGVMIILGNPLTADPDIKKKLWTYLNSKSKVMWDGDYGYNPKTGEKIVRRIVMPMMNPKTKEIRNKISYKGLRSGKEFKNWRQIGV